MWNCGLKNIFSHLLLTSLQTNVTSDTETLSINTVQWLEKIKKLATHNMHPPMIKQTNEKSKKSCY